WSYKGNSSRAADCKVYVGDLGNGAAKGELERAFSYYGPLRSVWVARNPPGFAFVEYEDARDAEDAVKGMDGKVLCGSRVRVEMSNGMSRKSRYGRPSRRQFDPNDRCYQCGECGHYAYDCYRFNKRRSRRSRSGSRSRSRSRGRRYRSRSRSNERTPLHFLNCSPARSRSRTPVRRSRSPVRRSKSPVRRSRSRTPVRRDRYLVY
uniref:Serine and arginine rich splicing factor 7a n=2 Tax=Cyprinus carpio TaxID=7962 RepID=A0A8C1UD24_CYPCA